jgi:ABC-type sugar transport system permease subunit
MKLKQPLLSETMMLAIFLIPLVAVLLVTDIIPLGFSTYLATSSWQLIDRGASATWVGIENFRKVIADPVFRDSFRVSIEFALGSTLVELLLGLVVAYMVVGESWTMRAARTIMIVPMFIPGVVVGTIWRMMLNVNSGIVNYALGLIGIPPQTWFSAANTAMPSIILVDVWYSTSFVIVLLVAGISTLPPDPVRAAMVDGASRWQVFRYIMLPMLTPVLSVAALFRFIGSFFVLDHVYTTTYGGPGFATNAMSFHLYRQGLQFFNLSYTAAASWLMIGFALLVILVLSWLRRVLERHAGP